MRLIHRANGKRFPAYNSAYLPIRYPLALYSFALALKEKNYVAALRFFEPLLGRQLPRTPYNEAIMEFVRLRAGSNHIGFIQKQLRNHWGEWIATKVLSEVGPHADISAVFQLPTCFRCSECPTKSKCALCDLSKMDAIIRRKYSEFVGRKKE